MRFLSSKIEEKVSAKKKQLYENLVRLEVKVGKQRFETSFNFDLLKRQSIC